MIHYATATHSQGGEDGGELAQYHRWGVSIDSHTVRFPRSATMMDASLELICVGDQTADSQLRGVVTISLIVHLVRLSLQVHLGWLFFM